MNSSMRLIISLIVACSVVVSGEKRLVLHNDLDLSSAFSNIGHNFSEIEKRFASLESRIGNLESENAHLAAENKLLATVNAQLTTENQDLGTKVARLDNNTQQLSARLTQVGNQSGGSAYIRWGRSTCPGNGTSLVYTGYIGGTLYTDKGGGSNSLCMAANPTWNKYVDGFQGDRSAIYGLEIEDSTAFSIVATGSNFHNQDPPCASCLTSRATVTMVSGRSNCYPGWTLEYTGYLVGGHGTHSTSDFICLDAFPEALPHGLSNDDQHILFYVEAHCGSLPCPPYHDGREVACVVCSK